MTTYPAWAPLASQALTEAVLDHSETARHALQQLADEHGPDVIPGVMLAWIDTLLAKIPPPAAAGLVGLVFRREDSDRVTGADEVKPEVAWAGRLIAARANDDEPQARALIDSVPSDQQWARNVGALLSMVALNLREAGWGRPVQPDHLSEARDG